MTDRSAPRTTLQKLLSRFHFGVTLFAVALSALFASGVVSAKRRL